MREIWVKNALSKLYERLTVALAKNDRKLIDQIRSEESYLKSNYEKKEG